MRRAREARRESLRQAAAQLEVAPSHLSRLERGEKSASKELLWRAARYYDLRPEDVGAQDVPEDIREILRAHPEIVWELRQRYGQ
nr:helix-turn-helix transcriptional regulator [Cellulomonas uda]